MINRRMIPPILMIQAVAGPSSLWARQGRESLGRADTTTDTVTVYAGAR